MNENTSISIEQEKSTELQQSQTSVSKTFDYSKAKVTATWLKDKGGLLCIKEFKEIEGKDKIYAICAGRYIIEENRELIKLEEKMEYEKDVILLTAYLTILENQK